MFAGVCDYGACAKGTRGRLPCGLSGSQSDKVGQAGHEGGSWHGEAVTEEVIERDIELGAGFEQAEHGITGSLAGVADGSAGELALGDPRSDVVFRSVGVDWDFERSRTRSSSAFRSCRRASRRSSRT